MQDGEKSPNLANDLKRPSQRELTPWEVRRRIWADVATILSGWCSGLALLVAVITAGVTFKEQHHFNEEQLSFNQKQAEFNRQAAKFQAESAALEALRSYFSSGMAIAPSSARNQWLTNEAFFTAETLYNLRNDDNSWLATAQGLILAHRELIDSRNFDCEKYSPGFVEFVQLTIKYNPCHPGQLQKIRKTK